MTTDWYRVLTDAERASHRREGQKRRFQVEREIEVVWRLTTGRVRNFDTPSYFGRTEYDKLVTRLVIRPGFRWDGASGPTRQTETVRRASAFHDMLYDANRMGHLQTVPRTLWKATQDPIRLAADRLYGALMVEDGAPRWRARLHVSKLRWAGGRAWKG